MSQLDSNPDPALKPSSPQSDLGTASLPSLSLSSPSSLQSALSQETQTEPVRERRELPIDKRKDDICQTIEHNRVTIIVAEPGAGKSTRVPQWLAQQDKKVVVTEPRIIAAKSLAKFVAEEMGETLGERVGYRTALYHEDSPNTQLLYCTDGLEVVRQLMDHDKDKDVLVIDEIHEWNLNMEVLLAWVKHRMKDNPQQKIVIMSATVEAQKIADFLGGAAIIEVEGRTFPVQEQKPGRSLEDDIARFVKKGKNVLAFQPGKKEIERTIEILQRMDIKAELIPLHGDLTLEAQDLAFKKYDKPKVVVATNIAQTSITIEDINAVVDSGLERQIRVVDGVEGLYLSPISLADMIQRLGRAGRTQDGEGVDGCPVPRKERPAYGVPEMERVRVDQAILRLLDIGIDIEQIEFLHQPAKETIAAGKKTLRMLGCIAGDEKHPHITELGRQIAQLSCSSPICGRMILEARARGVLDPVITAAAIIESNGIVDPSQDMWLALCGNEQESDLLAQVEIFNQVVEQLEDPEFDQTALLEFCADFGLRPSAIVRAIEQRKMIIKNLKMEDQEIPSSGDREQILKSFAAGFAEHIYQSDQNFGGDFRDGADVRSLSTHSVIRPDYLSTKEAAWVAAVPFDLQVGDVDDPLILNLLNYTTCVNSEWLPEIAPQLTKIKRGEEPTYSLKNDQVYSTDQVFFKGTLLKKDFHPDPTHPKAAEAFASWLAETMLGRELPKRGNKVPGLQEAFEANQDFFVGRRISKEALTALYVKQLDGASSFAELNDPSLLRLE